MKSKEQARPRARTQGLLVQELDGEVLVYDRLRHKAHCLNQTAALVWHRCDGNTNADQIALLLSKKTDSTVDQIVVWMALKQLATADLLEGDAPEWREQSGITRREVIRRIGVSAAIVLPVVSTIVAPRAIQAGTCGATGIPCISPSMCCSFLCNMGTCA